MRIFATWQKRKPPTSAEVAVAKAQNGQDDAQPAENGIQ